MISTCTSRSRSRTRIWSRGSRKARRPVSNVAAWPITEIDSIYFRDPNGYVIELTGKRPEHDTLMDPSVNEAHDHLDQWQSEKRARR